MLVFRMHCRITQSFDAHRTESVPVMDHEQTKVWIQCAPYGLSFPKVLSSDMSGYPLSLG